MTYKEKIKYWTEYCNQQKQESLEAEDYESADVWKTIPYFLTDSTMKEIVDRKSNDELEDIIDDLFSYGLGGGEPLFQTWNEMFLDGWFDWCRE